MKFDYSGPNGEMLQVGVNDAHLSTFSEKDFVKEVKHHFPGESGKEQMKELYRLIQFKNKSQKREDSKIEESAKEGGS